MRLSETDEIAVELYLVPPARFVAARDQVVRQARAAGHRQLAQEVSGLRRPTLSAWLVNALARHQRERMRQLFAVGKELRQAQTRLEGDQLRRLPAQREELITELLDWARRHAAEAGLRPTEAALAEVEATLQAGLVDLGAAAAVMSGHLVRPMSHAGFGPLPQVEPAPSPPEPRAETDWDEWRVWPVEDELARRRDRSADGREQTSDGQQFSGGQQVSGGRQASGRWEAATVVARYDRSGPAESVRRAEIDLAEAASNHWQREHDLAEAEAAMQAVKDRQEMLEQQRMQLRREKVAAEQDLAAARAAQIAALRALTDARRALEAAEQRIHDD